MLVIRLRRNNTARDYAVPINFTGRRWIEIPTAEQAWRLKDWGLATATHRIMDYQYVDAVEIGIGYLPGDTSCSVLVEELQALEESAEALVNPSISLGGQTINITGSIPSESHFVLEPDGVFTVYDEHWNTISSQSTGAPLLPGALTPFSMTSASASSDIWLEVGVQASSETLQNPAYTANGTLKRWLDDYNLVTGGDYEAAEQLDPDQDGLLNREEFICGTDPTNQLSVLRLTGIAPVPGGHALQWKAVAGKVYNLLYKTNLTDVVWKEEVSGIPGTEHFCTYTSAVDSTSGFFRIEVGP